VIKRSHVKEKLYIANMWKYRVFADLQLYPKMRSGWWSWILRIFCMVHAAYSLSNCSKSSFVNVSVFPSLLSTITFRLLSSSTKANTRCAAAIFKPKLFVFLCPVLNVNVPFRGWGAVVPRSYRRVCLFPQTAAGVLAIAATLASSGNNHPPLTTIHDYCLL